MALTRTILFQNVEPNLLAPRGGDSSEQRSELAAAYRKAIDACGRRNSIGRRREEGLIGIDDVVYLEVSLNKSDCQLRNTAQSHSGD